MGSLEAPVWLAEYPRRVTVHTSPPTACHFHQQIPSSLFLREATRGRLVQKSHPGDAANPWLQECGKKKAGAWQGKDWLWTTPDRIFLLR